MLERIIIIRHGETRGTAKKRYYGSTDMPLSPTGAEQAKRLRKWLKRYPIHYIYTSPLKRCKETTSIIKGKRKIPTIVLPELREVDFGRWEGLTLTEIQNQYPRKLKSWLLDFERFQMPGGDRVRDMVRRARKAWRGIIKKHPQESIPSSGFLRASCRPLGPPSQRVAWDCASKARGNLSTTPSFAWDCASKARGNLSTILIVTHGGPAKVMVMAALGLSMKKFWHLRIDTGSASVIESIRDNPIVRHVNVVP